MVNMQATNSPNRAEATGENLVSENNDSANDSFINILANSTL